MELRGAVALVTGAGRRIGRVLASTLAGHGLSVGLHCHRSCQETLELVAELNSQGRTASLVEGDLLDPDQATALIATTRQALGAVRVLINSAAIFHPGGVATTDLAGWNHHLAVNLTAPWLLMRAFANQPEWSGVTPGASPAGKVINLLDQRVLRPQPGHVAYQVAKAGLWTLTQLAAMELAPTIQVNALALGAILPAHGSEPTAFRHLAAQTPAGRPGLPEEVAQAMLFLLHHDYMTGQLLAVDGGGHLTP